MSLDSSLVVPLLFFTRTVVCLLPQFSPDTPSSPLWHIAFSDKPSSADELSSLTASSSSAGDAPPPPTHGFHALTPAFGRWLLQFFCHRSSQAKFSYGDVVPPEWPHMLVEEIPAWKHWHVGILFPFLMFCPTLVSGSTRLRFTLAVLLSYTRLILWFMTFSRCSRCMVMTKMRHLLMRFTWTLFLYPSRCGLRLPLVCPSTWCQ